MKKLVPFFLLNLIHLGLFAQGNTNNDISFCGHIGQGKASVIYLTRDELNKCDLKVETSDSNLTIMSFTLTLFSKKDNRSVEIKVKGNTIPQNIREQVNHETKKFLVEYIRAQDELGTLKLLEAITVNIE